MASWKYVRFTEEYGQDRSRFSESSLRRDKKGKAQKEGRRKRRTVQEKWNAGEQETATDYPPSPRSLAKLLFFLPSSCGEELGSMFDVFRRRLGDESLFCDWSADGEDMTAFRLP